MKKALLLVQGIAKDSNYIEGALNKSGIPTEQYDLVNYVPTEKHLDNAGWFSFAMRFVPWANKKWDQYGDIYRYFYNKKTRRKVCGLVNEYITHLHKEGYEVDIAAHSLGSIIALTCGKKNSVVKISKFFSFGSPLGFKLSPFKGIVNKHVRKFSYNLEGHRFHYCGNEDDFVCTTEPGNKTKNLINDIFKEGYHGFMSVSKGHSILGYFQDFYKEYKNFFLR